MNFCFSFIYLCLKFISEKNLDSNSANEFLRTPCSGIISQTGPVVQGSHYSSLSGTHSGRSPAIHRCVPYARPQNQGDIPMHRFLCLARDSRRAILIWKREFLRPMPTNIRRGHCLSSGTPALVTVGQTFITSGARSAERSSYLNNGQISV